MVLRGQRRGDRAEVIAWHVSMPAGYVAAMREAGYAELSLSADHALVLQDLPWRHGDPFDRLIIAQAIAEDLHVMTADAVFAEYPVNVI